jgi:hypothetical protein
VVEFETTDSALPKRMGQIDAADLRNMTIAVSL